MAKSGILTVSETDEIIRRLKMDEKSALDDLFHHYYPRLFSFSKSILKIETGIDDILQEVFIKIWFYRQKITSSATFNAFIYTVTKNEILNLIRTKIKDQAFRDKLFLLSVAEEYQPDTQLEYEEIKSVIDKIVSELPAKRQEVFVLSRTEGLSCKEIAQRLNISEKTVEDHITHSIRKIKFSLKELGILPLLYLYLFL
jgi:RNA polymerase sigma-70 factor (family 1)